MKDIPTTKVIFVAVYKKKPSQQSNIERKQFPEPSAINRRVGKTCVRRIGYYVLCFNGNVRGEIAWVTLLRYDNPPITVRNGAVIKHKCHM
jgi:hypothetical protein